MKRVIFTTYDDINADENFENVLFANRPVADNANQLLVKEYFDRLVQNKKDYAVQINAHFIFYHNEMCNFLHMPDLENEMPFTRVNLYKHYLMDKLADEYDEICYVDMDVLFDTDKNIFDEHDLSKGIHVRGNEVDPNWKDKKGILFEEIGLRSPVIKYHITKDLLDGKDNYVMNTGIVLGRSEFIKQVKLIDRIPEVIEKIKTIKDDFSANFNILNLEYYPNNESIFSYTLEKYNIPYVLLSEEWHYICGDRPTQKPSNVYCYHFINKQFNAFYKEKTQCIFSIHIDLPDHLLDKPKSPKTLSKNKSKIAQEQFKVYEKQLKQNHKEYADAIGATYKIFGWDEQYEEFRKRFTFLTEYNIINLYKIWLLDKLTQEYDHVMYVDLDVYFHSHDNIFDYVPCDYALCARNDPPSLVGIRDSKEYFEKYTSDFRSPHAKYWNAHAMLTENDMEGKNNVFNTGIVVAGRKAMESLDYFSDIDETLELMKELKNDEFSMYPENIRSSFGYDNETIFSYKVNKNKAITYNLGSTWHNIHYNDSGVTDDAFKQDTKEWKNVQRVFNKKLITGNVVITHLISKNFSLVFNK